METAVQDPGIIQTDRPEDPLSDKVLSRLFFLSSTVFILSALLIQFLLNGITAILLKHYSISFIYSLFSIDFTFISGTKWTVERICIVNTTGYLLLFITGMLLLRIRVSNWKWKIVLSWLSFVMIHALPMAFLAGIFIYDSFGVAYIWLVQNIIVRSFIATAGIAAAIYFRPFWVMVFLSTAFSSSFFSDDAGRKQYISFGFLYPWIAGAIVIIFFALTHLKWFWLVSILGTGLVVFPIFSKIIPPFELTVSESKMKVITGRYYRLFFFILLTGIWLFSFIKITM